MVTMFRRVRNNQPLHNILYWTTRFFAFPFFKILFGVLTRYEILGQDNVPQRGPLVIVSNHLSDSDQYLLYIAIKRRLAFMANDELFRSPAVKLLAMGFGAFPVHRNKIDRKAITDAYQVLDKGVALVMFPEGARSRSAQLRPALSGTALIALEKKVPILPVGITGMEAKWKGIPWAAIHRPRVGLNIGRPFSLPEQNRKLTNKRLGVLTDYIMGHIAALLPPEYRGYYARMPASDHV
jgi:1-acyl-sn-glycerol-3-phosphate acyltransferase